MWSGFGQVTDTHTHIHAHSLWDPSQAMGNSGASGRQIREHKSAKIKSRKVRACMREKDGGK